MKRRQPAAKAVVAERIWLSLEQCTFTHAAISFRRATRSLSDFPDRLRGNSSSSAVDRFHDDLTMSVELCSRVLLAGQALRARVQDEQHWQTPLAQKAKPWNLLRWLCCGGGLFDRDQIWFQLYLRCRAMRNLLILPLKCRGDQPDTALS